MKPAYLVIDQGGHGTRALVFSSTGEIIHSFHAALTSSNPKTGWYEQSPQELINSIGHCLANLATHLHTHPLPIESAALITQRSSLVACYRHSLEAITPIISWQDTRNNDWLQKNIDCGQFDIAALKKLTGLRLNAHYGASKMRWLLENNSAVKKADEQNNLVFLPLAAYVTHLLTKSKHPVLDAASASRTFLTEFGKTEWSPRLLNLFSIKQSVLPDIVSSRSCFGNINLGEITIPLQVVGGDQSFLPFAYGQKMLANSFFINAGTGAFIQAQMSEAETPHALLSSLAAIDKQQQLTVAEGTVNACASALDWLFQQEGRTLPAIDIEKALCSISSPPVFYHRMTALGSPYWLATGSSSFSDTSLSHQQTLEEKTVAVVESIIFLLAINIDLLKQAKPALQQILISGGISSLDGFCQKLANTTRLPVIRCTDHEASSRGAAFYLANVASYPLLDATSTFPPQIFPPQEDRLLLARYQHFYEWLRNEWMKNSHLR